MMVMFFTITTQVTFLSSYALVTEGGGGGSIVPYLLADMDRRVQI